MHSAVKVNSSMYFWHMQTCMIVVVLMGVFVGHEWIGCMLFLD